MNDDTKRQMAQAKRHIQAKQYDEARVILKKVKHPTATKWLKKLDDIAPVSDNKSKGNSKLGQRIKIGIIIAGILFVVLFFVMDNARVNNNINNLQARMQEATEYCESFGYTGQEYADCLDRQMDN